MPQLTLPKTYPERFERWLKFHREHPQVWELFKAYAEQMHKQNSRGSARMIGERIRWYSAVEVQREAGQPKYNDHFWPYFSRLLMATDSRFENFFETRDTKFDIDTKTLAREAT